MSLDQSVAGFGEFHRFIGEEVGITHKFFELGNLSTRGVP